jgi:GntR family transcriptional regulator
MFVAPDAYDTLLAERRARFADRYLDPLLAEARTLGLSADDLATLIRDRGASTASTHERPTR